MVRLSPSILLYLLTMPLFAQFVDDFSDGDFTNNPEWQGQTDRFIVEDGVLRLNAPAVQELSYLSVSSAGLDNGIWEFNVKMDFATSSTSLTKVYLMSTSNNLLETLNGYFVLIGGTPDEVSLFRQDGDEEVKIIDGTDKSIDGSSVDVNIRVTRDSEGNWELLRDENSGNNFSSEGSVNDNTYRITAYFGVVCQYTASRSTDFFFDNFSVTGTPILDTEPPQLLSANAKSLSEVEILFDESLAQETIITSNFTVDQGLSVINVSLSENLVTIITSEMTNGRVYNLTVLNVQDLVGNVISIENESTFSFIAFSEPQENELVLSEVLFNPRTDGVDFVELYNNTTDKFFNLIGWKFARISEGTQNNPDFIDQIRTITEEDFALRPGEYKAFTEDIEILAFEYPDADRKHFVEIDDLPSYNNDEGTVILLNQSEDTVQFFQYSEDYHYELLESNEGVSLERVVFSENENDPNIWRSASSSVGFATPGLPNSQQIENLQPSGQLDIEPKIFLPGNAGTGRDFTTINYQLEKTGQFANINIYDQNGRLVSTLANGESLQTSGFFRWDGQTNRGGTARMGHYLVVFELYDGIGNRTILKDTVVVAHDF